LFAVVANDARLFALGQRIARWLQPLHSLVKGTRLDPARAWTKTRELPPMPEKTFKQLWRERSGF
jgi:hypothetical protein